MGTTRLADGWLLIFMNYSTITAWHVCFTRLFKTLLPTAQLTQEVERLSVNYEVVGSSHMMLYFFSSLYKVPSAVGLYAAYSVKQDLLQSFSTYSFNANNYSSVYVLPNEYL